MSLNESKEAPINHRRRFTEEEQWDVIAAAGNEDTKVLASRFGRKPKSMWYLYKKLGINFFDHDKRLSVRQLAETTGVPASTLYDQIRKGKLTGLEISKVGRHIRVVWNGEMDALTPEWDGSKLPLFDPVTQNNPIRENCVTCNSMLVTPPAHGKNLYCTPKCKGAYKHWLFEERRIGSPMTDRPFPAHLRFEQQNWLADDLGLLRRQVIPEEIDEVFKAASFRVSESFGHQMATLLHIHRGYYLPWEFLIQGSETRSTSQESVRSSERFLGGKLYDGFLIKVLSGYGWGLGVETLASELQLKMLYFLRRQLGRQIPFQALHRDVYQTLEVPDNFEKVIGLTKRVEQKVRGSDYQLKYNRDWAIFSQKRR